MNCCLGCLLLRGFCDLRWFCGLCVGCCEVTFVLIADLMFTMFLGWLCCLICVFGVMFDYLFTDVAWCLFTL